MEIVFPAVAKTNNGLDTVVFVWQASRDLAPTYVSPAVLNFSRGKELAANVSVGIKDPGMAPVDHKETVSIRIVGEMEGAYALMDMNWAMLISVSRSAHQVLQEITLITVFQIYQHAEVIKCT